jgi:hypothetical protein
MTKKSIILDEMTKNQVKNIDENKMLSYRDMTRIVKNINTSIFSPTSCCIWTGYVTNVWNHKSTFINFYFKKKKVALHRLLYNNFVGPISDTEYIKFSCNNRGRCCNVLHFIKLSKDDIYEDKNNSDIIIDDGIEEEINDDDNDDEQTKPKIFLDPSAFIINFD